MLYKWLLDLVIEPSIDMTAKEMPWERVWIAGGFLLVIVVLLIIFYIKNKHDNE